MCEKLSILPGLLPSHRPSSWPSCGPSSGGTRLPVEMLWAESKGLMKGILWEASHRWRSTLASLWHCSSFREQKAQRGQAAVCRRPRLSQTWEGSLSKSLSLGRLFSPSHQTSRADFDVFPPLGLLLGSPPLSCFLRIPRGTSSRLSVMVSQPQAIFIYRWRPHLYHQL